MLTSLTSCDVHQVCQDSHRVLQFPAHWIIAWTQRRAGARARVRCQGPLRAPGCHTGNQRSLVDHAWEAGVWFSLTFGDAVLSGQEALLEEALQHGAHGRPVDQLQHEEVGLQGRVMFGSVPRPPWPTHL